jgi:glycerol-3-phosphate dehydrogenase
VPGLRKGFVYADGWIDDARLVILNLKSAVRRGARILPRTRFIGAEPLQQGWRAKLSADDGSVTLLDARALVNAAGPWVDTVRATLSPALHARTRPRERQPYRGAGAVCGRSRVSAPER